MCLLGICAIYPIDGRRGNKFLSIGLVAFAFRCFEKQLIAVSCNASHFLFAFIVSRGSLCKIDLAAVASFHPDGCSQDWSVFHIIDRSGKAQLNIMPLLLIRKASFHNQCFFISDGTDFIRLYTAKHYDTPEHYHNVCYISHQLGLKLINPKIWFDSRPSEPAVGTIPRG